MGIFGKSKKELLVWQNTLLLDKTDKLMMNQKQLQELSDQQASNDLRIIQDCIKIIEETVNTETFFTRLELLKERSRHLKTLEPYVKFSGASPTAALNEVLNDEQPAIYALISRCYNSAFDKAEKLKTEKGKKNQYQKIYESLDLYRDKMDQHNIKYLEYKFKEKF